MKINDTFIITQVKDTDNTIITNLFTGIKGDAGNQMFKNNDAKYPGLKSIYDIVKTNTYTKSVKNDRLRRQLSLWYKDEAEIEKRLYVTDDNISADLKTMSKNDMDKIDLERKKKIATDAMQKLINFFSEYNFTPSFRFVNSFVLSKDPITYVNNYFEVQDHPCKKEIKEKTKSPEFKEIVKSLVGFTPKPINTRFELYYGEPGTGKTTKAYKVCEGRIIVCSSDMLPADLMQNFCFKDGKADFDPSDLWKAMEEGKKIALDEVNMLPFESLRFLQGITDGKETFDYKGHTIKIHPNFKIYATMNLNVNGQCIPLPAPLVDRSYEIVEFKITAKDLVNAIIDFEEENSPVEPVDTSTTIADAISSVLSA